MAAALAAAVLACIAAVHDGDSIRLCDGERVRISGIDAPEMNGSPRCTAEARRRLSGSANPSWCDGKLAMKSRDELARLLKSGPVRIERVGVDRY